MSELARPRRWQIKVTQIPCDCRDSDNPDTKLAPSGKEQRQKTVKNPRITRKMAHKKSFRNMRLGFWLATTYHAKLLVSHYFERALKQVIQRARPKIIRNVGGSYKKVSGTWDWGSGYQTCKTFTVPTRWQATLVYKLQLNIILTRLSYACL